MLRLGLAALGYGRVHQVGKPRRLGCVDEVPSRGFPCVTPDDDDVFLFVLAETK